MDFEEAFKIKTSMGNSIVYDGFKMQVFVTPEDSEDFSRYFADYIKHLYDYASEDFTDKTAKLYSRNNQFNITGLWENEGDYTFKILRQN